MSYLNTTAKVAKDTALTTELNNIRMAIEVYRVINGKAPDDLNALAKQQLTYKESDGSIIGKPYIDIARVDKDGSLADPFLNKYYYNATSGKVSSQTKGYESW